MAKTNIVWLVALAAVLALVYYLYEGGKFSEGNGGCLTVQGEQHCSQPLTGGTVRSLQGQSAGTIKGVYAYKQ